MKKCKKERNSSLTSEWSTLQREMLEEITKRLATRTDILHVRAVCKAWRSIIPIPIPIPPHSFTLGCGSPLKPPFPSCIYSTGDVILRENTIYCIEPLRKIHSARRAARNWFVKIEHRVVSGKVRVGDPLSGWTIKDLGNIRGLPMVLNLLDYKVREVGKEYYFEILGAEVRKKLRSYVNHQVISAVINKAVVGRMKKDVFVIMAHDLNGELKAWRMGEDRWEVVGKDFSEFGYDDVAYCNAKFYALDQKGQIIAVDASSLDVTQLALPTDNHGSGLMYLVESLGNLFLINMTHRGFLIKIPHLEIYKLNEEHCKWIAVHDLEDRVLFMGNGFSFSVSAREFAGCKQNCIYFTDSYFLSDSVDAGDDYPGCDAGLFDLVDNSAHPLRSVLGYSEIFWPPPTWLKRTPNDKYTLSEEDVA